MAKTISRPDAATGTTTAENTLGNEMYGRTISTGETTIGGAEEDMKRIALLVKGAKRYFLQKYVDNDNCIEHGFTAVDRDTAEKWLSLFDGVDNASLRGY